MCLLIVFTCQNITKIETTYFTLLPSRSFNKKIPVGCKANNLVLKLNDFTCEFLLTPLPVKKMGLTVFEACGG